jgi:choline dehydrogenase-like flavoprotein
MEFDYIVVGAGAAGCAVARRLSEDPRHTVLLVEYGGPARDPMLHIPKGFYYTLRGNRYLYRYETKGHEVWLRGRVAGGSTAINGMIWSRGAPADWDGLAVRGNPGWAWRDILPAYRALENHSLGESDTRGAGGPIGISVPKSRNPVTTAILESAINYGWKQVEDLNDSDEERIGYTPSTIRNGMRVSSYAMVGRSAANGSNITVTTRTRAESLLFSGERVTGVRIRRENAVLDVTARREVIVSAGTIETPMLLERSGIGHPDLLKELGIPVRRAALNLGERVIEQRGVMMQVIRKSSSKNTINFLRNAPGFLFTGGYDLTCQFKSSPGVPRPDIQAMLVPMAIDTGSEDLKLARHPGIIFMAYPIRPTAYSSVHSSGASPADPPVIEEHYLESGADRAVTGPVLGIGRAMLAQGPVAALIDTEEFPGPGVSGPEATVEYARKTGTGIYHAVGSAAMGPADDDVVDARLRVRGVPGLRIADASVLPVQVSGNTAAPAMAVGWRAAGFILDGELRSFRPGRPGPADQAVEDPVQDPVEVGPGVEELGGTGAEGGGEPGVAAGGDQFGELRELARRDRGGGGQFGADHVQGESVDQPDHLQLVPD